VKRRLIAVPVLAAAAALVLGGACGLEGSETNEIGLVYSGGWIEDKEFKEFLPAGSTNKATGFGSKTYRYRIDQRSYRADAKGNGADTQPAVVVSNDDQRLRVDYQLYFKLNQDEKILRKFHENIGVKTQAWTDDGWKQMLRDYFEPQIERSLEAAALGFNWRDLYASEEARVAYQNDAIGRIKAAITDVIGDDYFCGPSYTGKGSTCGDFTMTVGKPEPVNEALVAAIEAEQTNVAATQAQEQKNAQTRAELDAERELVALYGAQGALLREAIRSGKVQTFIVDPNDLATVNAPVPAQR
jgi:hypothetical protein